MDQPTCNNGTVPGPTLAQRHQLSHDISRARVTADVQTNGRNTPLIISVVVVGLFGLFTIAIVASIATESTTVILTGLISTFCGTLITALLTLANTKKLGETDNKLAETNKRMDGRFDELLELNTQRGFTAGQESMEQSVLEKRVSQQAAIAVQENIQAVQAEQSEVLADIRDAQK